MTTLNIDAIEARAKAQPYTDDMPWRSFGHWVGACTDPGNPGPELPEPPFWEPVCDLTVGGTTPIEAPPQMAALADFIAHAREDIPALITRIRDLESSPLGDLQQALADIAALTAENRRLTSERDIACQRVARVEVARCAAVEALEAMR